MPRSTPEPFEPKRTREGADDRALPRHTTQADEDAPDVQLGEDPGTLGREDLDEDS